MYLDCFGSAAFGVVAEVGTVVCVGVGDRAANLVVAAVGAGAKTQCIAF